MAAEYLENDSQTRTLVRTCQNYKNVAWGKEMFDENTVLCSSDKSFVITVNFIKPIVEYTKENIFQLTKRPEKNSAVIDSADIPHYYGCITPIKIKMGEDLKEDL